MYISKKRTKKTSEETEQKFKFGGKNSDDDDETDIIESKNNHIYLYSDINNKAAFEMKKTFDKVKLEIANLETKYGVRSPIHLHINSFGGCLFSAFSIIDTIRLAQQEGFEVYTYCEGKVASSGTLISVHGDKRFMGKNTVLLIHQLSSAFWGKFTEIEDEMENCNMLMKKLQSFYKDNCKFKKKDLENLLKRDLWLESNDCLKFGLIDEIL